MDITLTTYHSDWGAVMSGRLDQIDEFSPYWVQSKLLDLTACDAGKKSSDRLLNRAIFDLAIIASKNNVFNIIAADDIRADLSRCIVQMDSSPFERLISALSELRYTELIMEMLRLRHDHVSPEGKESIFRL